MATRKPVERVASSGARLRVASSGELSRLPSVDAVVAGSGSGLLAAYSHDAAVAAVRSVVSELRERLQTGQELEASSLGSEAVAEAAGQLLQEQSRPTLRRVVNATGVVLHTNLGRAWLADAAVEAIAEAARGACNLEYDVDGGARGDRDTLVEAHLCALTGAEAATVVNNNAAAVMLALNTLAKDREVIVSRGELVEIGGAFRIPDIMASSGARLREVGTTNRTRIGDYRAAIGADTAMLMKVHASNYRIVGFTAAVELAELAGLAAEHENLPVIEDLGAGALVDLSAHGLAPEPLIADRLRAGADLVLASGDKLLGGPQCGIIVGCADLIARLRKNPLKRALRCDKMTLAALEATLRIYRFAPCPEEQIPTLRYLLRPLEELRDLGETALALLESRLGESCAFELVETEAEAGSGSQPGSTIPSLAIAVRGRGTSATKLEKLFRSADPPIVGRIDRDVLLLDLRLIDDAHDLLPSGARF